jgi:hypothetical protein
MVEPKYLLKNDVPKPEKRLIAQPTLQTPEILRFAKWRS